MRLLICGGRRFNDYKALLLRPEYCVAFPGGAGTADMVRRASQLMPTWEPYK